MAAREDETRQEERARRLSSPTRPTVHYAREPREVAIRQRVGNPCPVHTSISMLPGIVNAHRHPGPRRDLPQRKSWRQKSISTRANGALWSQDELCAVERRDDVHMALVRERPPTEYPRRGPWRNADPSTDLRRREGVILETPARRLARTRPRRGRRRRRRR